MTPKVESHDRSSVSLRIDRRAMRKRTRLRCKPKRTPAIRYKKGLNAKGIARKPQFLLQGVPQGKSVHSTKFAKACFTPFGNDVNQHFRIALGSEDTARFFKLYPQHTIIVNFAVESN